MTHSAFDHMTRNAFQFLRYATSDYVNHCDQAAIRVYTAVELILKARLLHEHWSLIVRQTPNLAKFDAGDFVSVSFEEACERLANAINAPVPPEAKNAFNELRIVRNRLVHFASPRVRDDVKPWQYEVEVKAKIRAAWNALHNLMRGPWADVFMQFEIELDQIEGIMNR